MQPRVQIYICRRAKNHELPTNTRQLSNGLPELILTGGSEGMRVLSRRWQSRGGRYLFPLRPVDQRPRRRRAQAPTFVREVRTHGWCRPRVQILRLPNAREQHRDDGDGGDAGLVEKGLSGEGEGRMNTCRTSRRYCTPAAVSISRSSTARSAAARSASSALHGAHLRTAMVPGYSCAASSGSARSPQKWQRL